MSAEPQVFLDGEYPVDYALPRSGQTTALAKTTKASIFEMTAILECLWSFYEAMQRGKPLPNADEKLARIGSLLRNARHD